MNEEKYISQIRLSKHVEMPWDEIKKLLVYEMMNTIIQPMIDSGNYYAVKFDMVKRDSFDQFQDYYDEYAIIGRLSIAQEQRVIFPRMEYLEVEYHGQKFSRICNFCGNALMLDRRGGCNACGAPNGGYK